MYVAHYANYRRAGERRRLRSRRVNRHEVPDMAAHVEFDLIDATAFWWMLRTAQTLRQRVIPVPELRHARIVEPRQGARGWRPPIGGKHGLPHNKNPKLWIVRQAQRGLDGGGPPQTRRSSGRDEHQHARTGRRRAELVFKRRLVEIRQRRLPTGRLAGNIPVVCGSAQ